VAFIWGCEHQGHRVLLFAEGYRTPAYGGWDDFGELSACPETGGVSIVPQAATVKRAEEARGDAEQRSGKHRYDHLMEKEGRLWKV